MKLAEALQTRVRLLRLVRQRNHVGGINWSPQLQKERWFQQKLPINRPDDLIHHEELKAVENNPGDTTDNKYDDDADEDDSHVHLISDLCFSDMSVPQVNGWVNELNTCDSLDPHIDPGVEVGEAGEGENTGGDQSEQIHVVSGEILVQIE